MILSRLLTVLTRILTWKSTSDGRTTSKALRRRVCRRILGLFVRLPWATAPTATSGRTTKTLWAMRRYAYVIKINIVNKFIGGSCGGSRKRSWHWLTYKLNKPNNELETMELLQTGSLTLAMMADRTAEQVRHKNTAALISALAHKWVNVSSVFVRFVIHTSFFFSLGLQWKPQSRSCQSQQAWARDRCPTDQNPPAGMAREGVPEGGALPLPTHSR